MNLAKHPFYLLRSIRTKREFSIHLPSKNTLQKKRMRCIPMNRSNSFKSGSKTSPPTLWTPWFFKSFLLFREIPLKVIKFRLLTIQRSRLEAQGILRIWTLRWRAGVLSLTVIRVARLRVSVRGIFITFKSLMIYRSKVILRNLRTSFIHVLLRKTTIWNWCNLLKTKFFMSKGAQNKTTKAFKAIEKTLTLNLDQF